VGDVQHRIHHGAQVISVLPAALAGGGEHRLEQGPLLIGQIACVRHAGDGAHPRHRGSHLDRDTASNALLTPRGRLQLARCVVEQQWSLQRAAERFQVSPTTAARWAGRYREHGAAGMVDRSSRVRVRPHV
jgi:hypothetical protein